jgi:hypothetical protein
LKGHTPKEIAAARSSPIPNKTVKLAEMNPARVEVVKNIKTVMESFKETL